MCYDVDELLVGADFSINREAKEAKYDATCNIYDRNLNTHTPGELSSYKAVRFQAGRS